MITIHIYQASDNRKLAMGQGANMQGAMRDAVELGKRLRVQLQSDLYLRDSLGGLRGEILKTREGIPVKLTK